MGLTTCCSGDAFWRELAIHSDYTVPGHPDPDHDYAACLHCREYAVEIADELPLVQVFAIDGPVPWNAALQQTRPAPLTGCRLPDEWLESLYGFRFPLLVTDNIEGRDWEWESSGRRYWRREFSEASLISLGMSTLLGTNPHLGGGLQFRVSYARLELTLNCVGNSPGCSTDTLAVWPEIQGCIKIYGYKPNGSVFYWPPSGGQDPDPAAVCLIFGMGGFVPCCDDPSNPEDPEEFTWRYGWAQVMDVNGVAPTQDDEGGQCYFGVEYHNAASIWNTSLTQNPPDDLTLADVNDLWGVCSTRGFLRAALRIGQA